MFGVGQYAKVWGKKESKADARYSIIEISTSRKNKETNEYIKDFSSGHTRFIGEAHEKAKELVGGERIVITSCGVTNYWDKEKEKWFVSYLVFGYDVAGDKPNDTTPIDGEELPY